MHTIALQALNDFAEWRGKARELLRGGVAPEDVSWSDPSTVAGLFTDATLPLAIDRPVGSVPPAFIELAQTAINNSDPERFALLYRVLWRLQADRGLIAEIGRAHV